jgi:hypothetical protein
MALVKVQVQSITLIFGQGLQKSLNGRISDQFGQNSGLFPPRTQIGEAFGFLQIEVSIEVSRVQVAAAVNRALVGNQHKPRTKRSLLGIEDVSPAMHKQEAS